MTRATRAAIAGGSMSNLGSSAGASVGSLAAEHSYSDEDVANCVMLLVSEARREAVRAEVDACNLSAAVVTYCCNVMWHE